MAAKKKAEDKKKAAAKTPPKPRKLKLEDKLINCFVMDSHAILSKMEMTIPVALIGLSGDVLVKQVVDQIDPVTLISGVVRRYISPLLAELNEVRTTECVHSAELEVEYVADRDGDSLQFHMRAKVDPKGEPDLPYLTGKMAKEILETAFDNFDIGIDLHGEDPVYSQQTAFFFEAPGGDTVKMESVLPQKDVRNLYIAVVHQLFLQMLEGNVLDFYTAHNVHVTPEALAVITEKVRKEHHGE
jgi:hypothetical protein